MTFFLACGLCLFGAMHLLAARIFLDGPKDFFFFMMAALFGAEGFLFIFAATKLFVTLAKGAA